jgi:hypothetical protein
VSIFWFVYFLGILQSDGFKFDDKTTVYFPKVYTKDDNVKRKKIHKQSSSTTNHENDTTSYVGRLLQFSFGK